MYAQDSIDLLTKSGIDFKRHEDYGIPVDHFGELLMTSGLVLQEEVKWISFHRSVSTGDHLAAFGFSNPHAGG
jgi:CCR4-NOT transcription complex subunit 7/8